MLIYTTCSQVKRNGYYSHFRLENWSVIEDGFPEVSPGLGSVPRISYSGVLFIRFYCLQTDLADGTSWPPVHFFSTLCRWEFLSGLTKSQAFSTSCHHLVGVLWCLPGTYRNNTHNSPNPFLVLRLCHSLNAKNQICHELRFSQGINLSQSFLSSGYIYPVLRIQPLPDPVLWEMSIFIFTLFLSSN